MFFRRGTDIWFENLNLRGNYKQDILAYIKDAYPQLMEMYGEIYVKGNMGFWDDLSVEIEEYCTAHSIKHINYFYHKELVEAKKTTRKNKRSVIQTKS